MNRVDVTMRSALLLGKENFQKRASVPLQTVNGLQNPVLFGTLAQEGNNSKETLTGRFQLWVQRGMPLEWWVNYDAEEKLEKPAKQKLFWKKRLPLIPFLGALALGLWYSPQLEKPLPPPLSRASQPVPWGDNVRFYASTSQESTSMPYVFPYTLFYNHGAAGGTFIKALTDAVNGNTSLDKAFNTIRGGYGPWNRFKPVKSAEGPSIFDKHETGKTRKLFIIQGSGVNEKNNDSNAENSFDVELARKTFQAAYHLKDEEILVLHQPSADALPATLLKEKESPPDEVAILFIGEGNTVDYTAPAGKGQKPLTPAMEALEGGKTWAFFINDNEYVDEYELKTLIRKAFTKTDAEGKILKQSKIAMIAESCHSGAGTQ